jgi:uncharacterized membrane protein YgcG
MKNKILRILLVLLVSLTGKVAGQGQQARYDKFVVPHAGYLTVDQWVNWVASGNSSGMTVICDRQIYKQYLYAEIRNRGAVCNNDEDFLNLYRSGRFGSGLLWFNSLAFPFSNTAWEKITLSVVRLGPITMRYGYVCLDSEPIAKGTCANVINKNIAQVPAPSPAPAPQTGTFNPCDNQYYVLGPMDSNGFRWTSDGNMAYLAGIWYQKYTTDRNGQPYTDGLLHIDTLECQKAKIAATTAGCTTIVRVYNVNNNNSTPAIETGPVYSTMGRVYQNPPVYRVPVRQRTNFFSLALSVVPQYSWSQMPQMLQGRPVYQGSPFGGGSQYIYQNPNTYQSGGFDGGSGYTGNSSGGGPFGGGGYIPGVAQRVP